MKKSLLMIALSVLVLMSSAGAATINVCNTGENATCTGLAAAGSVDPHYTLTATADATNGPGPNAFVGTGIPAPWLANGPNSQWITPNVNGSFNLNPGNYTYTETFTLPVGFGTAQLSGTWATDNTGTASLNGTPFSTTPALSCCQMPMTAFSVTSGFVSGTNTLTFVVNNAGTSPNPTGLRVEISGSTNAVPEPTSLACVGAGLIALGGIARRLRASRR